jgi:hypothetical protein
MSLLAVNRIDDLCALRNRAHTQVQLASREFLIKASEEYVSRLGGSNIVRPREDVFETLQLRAAEVRSEKNPGMFLT